MTINFIIENELSVNIPVSKNKIHRFQDSTCEDIKPLDDSNCFADNQMYLVF